MSQFRDSFYKFVPPWLRTGNGERYMYTLELMRDLLMEKCDQAQRIRMPGEGDRSQIPFLAFDRQLVQGPNESVEAFVVRLRNAFPTWNEAGSAAAVLGQLQAYTQGMQAGVPANYPLMRIVSNPRTLVGGSKVNTWWSLLQGDAIGAFPALATVAEDFNWDGNDAATWRAWLLLYQTAVDTGQSGAVGYTSTVGGGSFTDPGELVAGVWEPRTTGTPVNAPFLTVEGLYGLTPENLGDMLTISGSAHPQNNGTFQIVEVQDEFTCVVANVDAIASDAGPLGWSVARYPWIAPALAWGSPGQVWGEGEEVAPTADTGSNVRGTWQPTTVGSTGERPSFCWGVRIDVLTIETIRALLRTWKSNGTYYPNIIIVYDGHDGVDPASCYTPFTNQNPVGNFGDIGTNEDGVWIPTRQLEGAFNAFCQGTGQAVACSVENIT